MLDRDRPMRTLDTLEDNREYGFTGEKIVYDETGRGELIKLLMALGGDLPKYQAIEILDYYFAEEKTPEQIESENFARWAEQDRLDNVEPSDDERAPDVT